jgi:hypothetical protein
MGRHDRWHLKLEDRATLVNERIRELVKRINKLGLDLSKLATAAGRRKS